MFQAFSELFVSDFWKKNEEISNYTLEAAFTSFLETESAQKSKKTGAADQRFFEIARHYFEKERGLRLLAEVQVEELQRFQLWLAPARECGELSKEPWIDTTIAHYCQKLKAVFNKAHRIGRIERNPVQYWSVPKGESRDRRPMTRQEFEKLSAAVPSWFLPVLRTLRLTGARGASIAMLTWDHVDFANGRLLLSSRKGGRKKLKQWAIPMLPELKAILIEIWAERDASGELLVGAPVFRDHHGQPITAQLIATIGSQSIKKAGLRGVTLYGLRHALATDLVDSGATPHEVQRLMGHSNLNQQLTYQKFVSLKPLEEALLKIRGDKKSE